MTSFWNLHETINHHPTKQKCNKSREGGVLLGNIKQLMVMLLSTITRTLTEYNEASALSLSIYHFLLSPSLLPPSVCGIVLHALVDSSCRASTFHIITTSDVCNQGALPLAETPPALKSWGTNEEDGSVQTNSSL